MISYPLYTSINKATTKPLCHWIAVKAIEAFNKYNMYMHLSASEVDKIYDIFKHCYVYPL